MGKYIIKMNMVRQCVLYAFFMVSAGSFGQVGINTKTPMATLEIAPKDPDGTSDAMAGLIIPMVDRLRAQSMTQVSVGTMLYINDILTGNLLGATVNVDAVGFYYYDGNVWAKSNSNIYNTDGNLSGKRIVNIDSNSLVFKGSGSLGMGTGASAASAILDLKAADKGFLLPRVALKATDDISTIKDPAAGLLVYNTKASGMGVQKMEANRIYLWSGTEWAKATVSSQSMDIRTSEYAYKYFTIDSDSPTNSLTTLGNISVRWPYTALGDAVRRSLQIRFNDSADYAIMLTEQNAVPASNGGYPYSAIIDIAANTWTNFTGPGLIPGNADWFRSTLIKVGEKAFYRISAQFNYASTNNTSTTRPALPAGCTLIIERYN